MVFAVYHADLMSICLDDCLKLFDFLLKVPNIPIQISTSVHVLLFIIPYFILQPIILFTQPPFNSFKLQNSIIHFLVVFHYLVVVNFIYFYYLCQFIQLFLHPSQFLSLPFYLLIIQLILLISRPFNSFSIHSFFFILLPH